MKQHITKAQYNKLSEKAKDRLRKWCFKTYPEGFLSFPLDSNCTNPLLSIGEMIEFLYEKVGEKSFNFNFGEVGIEPTGFFVSLPEKKTESPTGTDWGGSIAVAWNGSYIWKNRRIVGIEEPGELCDALWEVVKQKLEEE